MLQLILHQLRRRVACKVLSKEIDEQSLRRLRREAESAALMKHPNIVTIYDFDIATNQCGFLGLLSLFHQIN